MQTLMIFVLLTLVAAAGIHDIRFRKIPNWLTISGLVMGIGLNTYLEGRHGFAMALSGVLCAVAVYLPLYLIRGMGAGDVKLMAAVGAIAGPHNWFIILAATAISGGLISLIAVAANKRLCVTLMNLSFIVSELLYLRLPSKTNPCTDVRNPEAMRLPHAVTIAAGAIVFLILHSSKLNN